MVVVVVVVVRLVLMTEVVEDHKAVAAVVVVSKYPSAVAVASTRVLMELNLLTEASPLTTWSS